MSGDSDQPSGRSALWGPVALIVLGLCVVPLDGAVRDRVWTIDLAGDVKREFELLQQFGDFATSVIALVIILLLDPAGKSLKARRVCDWLAAALLANGAAHALKMFIGRPRPVFDDPLHVLGPFGKYPVHLKDGSAALIHAWDVSSGVASDLWSMPSSHAAGAAALAVVLAALYPRLRWFCVGIVVIVCLARVLLKAHYPSDVLIGSGLGWLIASSAMTHAWGSRLAGLLIPGAGKSAANTGEMRGGGGAVPGPDSGPVSPGAPPATTPISTP